MGWLSADRGHSLCSGCLVLRRKQSGFASPCGVSTDNLLVEGSCRTFFLGVFVVELHINAAGQAGILLPVFTPLLQLKDLS